MRILFLLPFLLFSLLTFAQSTYPDSLLLKLRSADNDSLRYLINSKLEIYYVNRDRKKSLEYNTAALEIARKNKMLLDVAKRMDPRGFLLNRDDKYGEAFKCYREGFVLAENPDNEMLTWSRSQDEDPFQYRMEILAALHHNLGHVHRSTGNNMEAIHHFKECLRYLEIALPTSYNSAFMNIGATFLDINELDSAYSYTKKALSENVITYKGFMYKYLGDIFYRQGVSDSAFYYYHQSLNLSKRKKDITQKLTAQYGLANWHINQMEKDSSLFYAIDFLDGIKKLQGNPLKDINISTGYELLYQAYQLNNERDSTLKYLDLAFTARDSLYREKIANLTQYQNISFEEQLRLEELEKEKLVNQNRIRIFSLLGGLIVIFIVALILYYNTRQKQQANIVLRRTLSELKSTQSQLIQSEKMASLGELTAGIAHEIQNPLNFVNNFSEVSSELLEEMKDEIAEGNNEDVLEIVSLLSENLEKINHHGERASSIVKGMLDHSRSSSGEKVQTNVNQLVDEYLRLAYHGLRAKDKTFNATYEMSLDESLPLVNIVPQDIGRVILNLINNAFYAVHEKSTKSEASNDDKYQPTVSVATLAEEGNIKIIVKDNGNGIPKHVIDKIFQPFFTTKPTGQGTGLGLSLSYDIVKAHGGELTVDSIEGENSSFQIQIPIIV
jgi:signal transduction histidine kinase